MTTQVEQKQCESGFYCEEGVSRSCPPGSYGSVKGTFYHPNISSEFLLYLHLQPDGSITLTPSYSPTPYPTVVPTPSPSHFPTIPPTPKPTRAPTLSPTPLPSISPTLKPVVSYTPTRHNPTPDPSAQPTLAPSAFPSGTKRGLICPG